jgi:subtilase family serine protease
MKRFLTSCAVAIVAISPLVITSPHRAAASGGLFRFQRVCSDSFPGLARCHAWLRTDASGLVPDSSTPLGLKPADLQAAYNLPSSTAGATQTVAIVDAFDDPNAEADLGVYRRQFGLPACTTANGCFKKVNQNGGTVYPNGNVGWAQEISLDLDMVSAICPRCKILLVEATNNSYANLGTSVNEAVKLGATVVSNSYGGSESSQDTQYDALYYNHPKTIITASSGDSGYGPQYPAASQYVVAVGGTSLSRATGTPRGWTETVWSGAGSGCSLYDPKPSWQHDPSCARRTIADVAAVADPNTGVSVYDSYGSAGQIGWLIFGGTSVASPVVAGVYALSGNATSLTSAGSLYTGPSGSLNDVTQGSNGSCGGSYLCTGRNGYDGPTGNGTPNGTGAF